MEQSDTRQPRIDWLNEVLDRCPECSGSGKRTPEEECEACKGTGRAAKKESPNDRD